MGSTTVAAALICIIGGTTVLSIITLLYLVNEINTFQNNAIEQLSDFKVTAFCNKQKVFIYFLIIVTFSFFFFSAGPSQPCLERDTAFATTSARKKGEQLRHLHANSSVPFEMQL